MLNLSLNHKSRMKREFHVRFCERWGGKFPLPTRPLLMKWETHYASRVVVRAYLTVEWGTGAKL